jgi:hypothetical protein
MLENLATRRKFAGDEVKIQIEREGKTMDISYRLPKYDYSNSLVPPADYDKEPEYLIVGGLVFQPLTEEYLQSWGTDWKRRAPFRLQFFREEGPTKERPALVLLSQVLPDAYNIGYQDQRYLVVDKVNGETISRVTQLPEALQHSTNGYHTIEFAKGETLRRMVLEAGGAEHEATQRVLKRYGIKQESHLASAER